MKQGARTIDLTEGSIWKKLYIFYLPLLASGVLQQLYNTVDAIVVGQFAGSTGLAAVSAVSEIARIPVNFCLGIGSGVTILVAQYFGAKNYRKASETSRTALVMSLAMGVIFTALMIAISRPVSHIMNVPGDIFDASLLYLRIYLCGMVFTFLYNAGAGVFRAVGNTRMPMMTLAFSGLANVVLDLLFVGPLHMGVAGAALATVLSQLFSAAFILFRLFRLEYPDGSSVKTEKGNRDTAFSTIKTSMPTAIRSSLWPIGNSFLYAAINAAGTDTIAAFSICSKLMLLLWLSIDSLGPSVTTFVAQNYGAGDLERARKGTRVGLFTGLAMMGLYSVALYFHGAWIGQIFLDNKSRDVLQIVDQILKMWSPFLCVYAFGSIFTGATSGYGDTVGPMFIILLCTCGFRIVWASTYCTAHPGMVGIILAYVLAYFLTGGVAMAYYFLVTRRRLRKAQTIG